MKKFLAAAVASMVASMVGCGGAPLAPAQTARAQARAAVVLVATADRMLAQACLNQANASDSVMLAEKCVAVLDPANDLIISAAEAVDTDWNQGAVCDLAEAATLLSGLVSDLSLDAESKAVIADAKALAAVGAAGCSAADAGTDR